MFEITKENKTTMKVLFVKHLLNGDSIFTIDRDNGKIVEITGFSMKTHYFRCKYKGQKTVSADWSVAVGETYAFRSYELFDAQSKIIAKKMR